MKKEWSDVQVDIVAARFLELTEEDPGASVGSRIQRAQEVLPEGLRKPQLYLSTMPRLKKAIDNLSRGGRECRTVVARSSAESQAMPLGGFRGRLGAALSEYQRAKSALEELRTELAETIIRAPLDELLEIVGAASHAPMLPPSGREKAEVKRKTMDKGPRVTVSLGTKMKRVPCSEPAPQPESSVISSQPAAKPKPEIGTADAPGSPAAGKLLLFGGGDREWKLVNEVIPAAGGWTHGRWTDAAVLDWEAFDAVVICTINLDLDTINRVNHLVPRAKRTRWNGTRIDLGRVVKWLAQESEAEGLSA